MAGDETERSERRRVAARDRSSIKRDELEVGIRLRSSGGAGAEGSLVAEEKTGGLGVGVAERVKDGEMAGGDERGPVFGHAFESYQRLQRRPADDLGQEVVVAGDHLRGGGGH